MAHLADNVVHFARVLRGAGIAVGTDRVMDAVRVLPLAGLGSREDWRATLATLFVTRHEQHALFDEAFDAFWRDPELEARMRALLLPKVQGRSPRAGASPRLAQALRGGAAARERAATGPGEVAFDAALTFAAAERLRHVDFEKMTGEEWEAARRLVATLELPVPELRTRRHERSRQGRAVDLAATMRRMAREGGELSGLVRRRPRVRPAPIVAICDISGSMHRYTRAFLHFLHALTREHGHVETLLFGTRLTHVTRALRHRDVDAAVDAVSTLVPDWAGGTRIAASLREFNLRWSRRLLAHNACVLLVTDGLERDDDGTLAAETARLRRASHRLVWLNPLLRFEGFSPAASGIRAMRPHVDDFLPVHDVESLAGLARALSTGDSPLFPHSGTYAALACDSSRREKGTVPGLA